MIPQYASVSCKLKAPHPDTGEWTDYEYRYPIPTEITVEAMVARLMSDLVKPTHRIISIEFEPFVLKGDRDD